MNTLKARISSRKGFTIVELLVVITIIGILASISIISYGAWRHSAISAKVKNDLNGVAAAMDSARTFNNVYPSTVPSSIVPSPGVTLKGGSTDGTTYCVEADSTEDTTITYYLSSTNISAGPQAGTCASVVNVPLPAVPTNLAAGAFISNSVALSWSAASGAANYNTQCAYDLGFVNGLQQATQSSTAVTLSGLTPSTIYCRVQALNNAGSSGWSSSITITSSLLSGLVAWYPLNGSANDATSNGNNGSINGAISIAGQNGQSNGAYSFNGSSNYIDSNTKLPSVTSSMTISAWIKPSSSQVQYANIWGNHANYFGVYMEQNSTTVNQYAWGYGTGSGWFTTGTFNLTAGSWQHVVAVKDSQYCRIYINGAEQTVSRVSCGTNIAPSTTTDFIIGQGFAARYFNGAIDDVRIYNRALSASEVSALYSQGAQ